MNDTAAPPLELSQRLGLHPSRWASGEPLVLHLTAEERTRLRGLRQTPCGQPLLLRLPRGKALLPGEWLAAGDGLARVRVDPAAEALLRVQADGPRALLQAAYHLGNRHVALEVRDSEVRLLADPVLEDLLRRRGLRVVQAHEPFQPEPGAYGDGGHHAHPSSSTDNAPPRPAGSASDDA